MRAIETTRDEAERLGAMALFGEKYGDRVRMVEIEDVSRELCGGTHVSATSEIGLFHVTTETSSASNVRRIEAVTGPEAARLFQERTERLNEIAARLKVPEHEVVHAVERLSERVKELERRPKGGSDGGAQDELVAGAEEIGGVRVVVKAVDAMDSDSLRDLSDAVRQKLGDAAVVLGSADDGRVHLVANVAPSVVERGVKAGDVVRAAAQVAGGGGGGRDTMAQAGGRDPEKLPDALATAQRRDREGARLMARSLPSTTGRPAAAAPSRTPAARSPRRCPLWSGPTRSAASQRSRGSWKSRARSAWWWGSRSP